MKVDYRWDRRKFPRKARSEGKKIQFEDLNFERNCTPWNWAIVIADHQFDVFRMEAGQPRLAAQSEPVSFSLVSFATHPNASSIVPRKLAIVELKYGKSDFERRHDALLAWNALA